MTREVRITTLTVALTVGIVLLAAGFAWLRNLPGDADALPERPAAPRPEADPGPPPDRTAAGAEAFERLRCSMCHSIGGRGNSSRPLDGVGARLDARAIRAWTLGTAEAADELPDSIVEIKARAADDPYLDAVIEYLANLP